MAYKFRLTSKAEEDIATAIEWYIEIDKALATDFLDEVNRGIEFIQAYPKASPVVFLDLRMYVLERFPYKIIYLIADNEIVVQAINHHKQHPDNWEKR